MNQPLGRASAVLVAGAARVRYLGKRGDKMKLS
jgi:hypothetical protein